jgi:hypothetical protein
MSQYYKTSVAMPQIKNITTTYLKTSLISSKIEYQTKPIQLTQSFEIHLSQSVAELGFEMSVQTY